MISVNRILIMFLPLSLLFSKVCKSQSEVSLYDSQGNAVAYIDTDDENTIYLWGGKPVAYLYVANRDVHIYGFNGKHLGWYVDGIIRDHSGDAVGFVNGKVSNIQLKYESYKGYKEYKPSKSYRDYAPYRPYLTSNFSNTPLSIFLQIGSDDNTNNRQQRIYSAPDPIMETDLDLLAKGNMQKERLFDERTKIVQNTIDDIVNILIEIKAYDQSYYNQQLINLNKYIKTISAIPVDYSDINQYNGVIEPLTSFLNTSRQTLQKMEISKPSTLHNGPDSTAADKINEYKIGDHLKTLNYAALYDAPDMINAKIIYHISENDQVEFLQKIKTSYYKVRVNNITGFIWAGMISKSE